jgi:hypothetical protein
MKLLGERRAIRRYRIERQTHAQILCARRCAATELSEVDRIAVEAGDNVSVRARFERDVAEEPGG